MFLYVLASFDITFAVMSFVGRFTPPRPVAG